MSFANHNILDIALSLIPPTVVQIRFDRKGHDNSYGQVGATYSDWIDVYGIVQPGGEQMEHVEGIDFAKKRVSIWLRGEDLNGNHIQEAPDQIRFVGRLYNVVSVDDWFPYDNYKRCECVEVLNMPESQHTNPGETPPPTGVPEETHSTENGTGSSGQPTGNGEGGTTSPDPSPAPAPTPPKPKIRI